jgi:hypothetical protein
MILPTMSALLAGSHEFECRMMGMKSGQRESAWQIVCRDRNNPEYQGYRKADEYRIAFWRALEEALEWERREILAILQKHYPAATRRIMKGYQRK